MEVRNKKQNALFIALTALIVLAVFLLTLEIINLNKIAFGLRVGDVKVGGLKTEQAKELLEEHFNQWERREIELVYGSKTFSVKPKEMGISLNLDKTLEEIYIFGRHKNILTGLYEQITALLPLGKKTITPSYDFNQEEFEAYVKKQFKNIENPAKFASLEYDFKKKNFKTIAPQEGYIFDRKKLKKDLEEKIKNLNSAPITLDLIKDFPEVLEHETQLARNQANQLLTEAPFYLVYNDKKWALDRETLLDWLEFAPIEESASPALDKEGSSEAPNKILGVTLNQEKIKNVLTVIAPNINQEPVNAQLTVKDGKVSVFALSRDGVRLDTDRSTEKILANLTAANPDNNIELVVVKKSPAITTDSIDNLGLTSLLGKGTSNFAGSPKNRTHNIKVGAAKFNGTLIKPGEEFSFNQILGEIGAKQGYLPELVIKKNKTIPEYGGGLCQVSTTMFRAAVNSGLKITERFPHAYPVKYYNPQGFDATIYPPHPDLKFINDTPRNILIQARVEGTILTFEFYGTADGREIKIKGPTTLQANPDGSMKTVLYQEIWRDGKMERQDKFFSSYKSPALYPIIRNPLE